MLLIAIIIGFFFFGPWSIVIVPLIAVSPFIIGFIAALVLGALE